MQFETDIASAHKTLFLNVREQILNVEGVTETKKDKITTYTYRGAGLCHLRTMPHGVDVGFLKGAFIDDALSMLHGKTKRMRVLSLESYKEQALNFYLTAALTLNE